MFLEGRDSLVPLHRWEIGGGPRRRAYRPRATARALEGCMDRTTTNQLPGRDDDDRIVAAEYERLRTSPLFTRSPVLSRLLQFLVEHRLQGGRSAPRAYAIATEALGRNADFDPAVDSYPRVMEIGRAHV